jgi:cyclic pyranopterin phosphate synthase
MIIARRRKLRVHFVKYSDYLRYKKIDAAREIKYYRQNLRIAAGVKSAGRAFTGPTLVQFDITNRCNSSCLACWTGSPLLKNQRELFEWKKHELSFLLIKKTLDELNSLGTRVIYFAGGGEPFMHPDIMRVISYAKKLGFECHMNTNFTLVDEKAINSLIRIGFDHINVSLWAATKETYAKLHPNKSEDTFLKIKENLKMISQMKRVRHTPHINLYNVINKYNYLEIGKMAELGLEVEADSVHFVPMDPMPGTEFLLLNKKERSKAVESIKKAEEIIKKDKFNLAKSNLFICEKEQFIRRMESRGADKGEYECEGVKELPCYAGWVYSRILANGEINFCLKSKSSVGNIHEKSFKEIWFSEKMNNIRKKFRNDKEKDEFFSKTGCFKTCDNIAQNQETENMLKSLNRRDIMLASLLK